MKGLSPKVAERIRQADANQDGALSVDELVEVIRTEMRAVSDRKLFRNILISLFVAVLVLVATLCGTVYAIVDLSKEVKNDNGLLVSSSSGDVMATGRAQQAMQVGPELFNFLNFPESLSSANSVIIPAIQGGNSIVYKVAKITSSPSTGTMEVNTVDGTILFMNQSGVYEVSRDGPDAYIPLFVSGGSRRRLMSDGSTENQGAIVVMGKYGGYRTCNRLEDMADRCWSDSCFCSKIYGFYFDRCRGTSPRFNEFLKRWDDSNCHLSQGNFAW
jgi:hypothetical protein